MDDEPATEQSDLDLIWGAEAIAKVIGRSVTQTQYLLRTGKLPAKQIGSRWVIDREQLERLFRDE